MTALCSSLLEFPTSDLFDPSFLTFLSKNCFRVLKQQIHCIIFFILFHPMTRKPSTELSRSDPDTIRAISRRRIDASLNVSGHFFHTFLFVWHAGASFKCEGGEQTCLRSIWVLEGSVCSAKAALNPSSLYRDYNNSPGWRTAWWHYGAALFGCTL